MFVRVKHGHPLSIRSGFFDVRANRHESARIYACLRFLGFRPWAADMVLGTACRAAHLPVRSR